MWLRVVKPSINFLCPHSHVKLNWNPESYRKQSIQQLTVVLWVGWVVRSVAPVAYEKVKGIKSCKSKLYHTKGLTEGDTSLLLGIFNRAWPLLLNCKLHCFLVEFWAAYRNWAKAKLSAFHKVGCSIPDFFWLIRCCKN